MNEPTEAQIREFWEGCGFREKADWKRKGFHYEATVKCPNRIPPNPSSVDEEYGITHLPRIDLNNLFKYAVPKLQEMDYATLLCDSQGELPYHAEIYLYGDKGESIFKRAVNDDPALAVFWAIKETL